MISYEEAMSRACAPDEWQLGYMMHWLEVAKQIHARDMSHLLDDLPMMPTPDEPAPHVEPHTSSARIPMPVATRDEQTNSGHTQRLESHLHIPLPDEVATEVIGALRNCYNCGQTITYDNTVQAWRHVTSGQRVCTVPGADDTIVYAWPGTVEAS
jgi:hypothetical protein